MSATERRIPAATIPVVIFAGVEAVVLVIAGPSRTYLVELAVSALALAACVLSLYNVERGRQLVFGLPLVQIASVFLIIQLVINTVVVLAGVADVTVLAILGIAIACAEAVLLLSGGIAGQHAKSVEGAAATSTSFIDSTREAIDVLAPLVPKDAHDAYQRLSDAARYANPVSNEKTANIEASITSQLATLDTLAKSGDSENFVKTCEAITAQLKQRDVLCKETGR